MRLPSKELLRLKSGDDRARVEGLYREWDRSARKKDFDECERMERRIKTVHDKHGIKET